MLRGGHKSVAFGAFLASTTGWASQASIQEPSAIAGETLVTMPALFERAMPSLTGATGWINSQPLSASDLNGKVVVVQFWTYSCINWLRTVPYIRAWQQKYRGDGLIVIGVHSPEFEFEQDVARVRRATSSLAIDYPVAVDSRHAVWNAFRNNYWPALYVIDSRGRIRHQRFGEGGYAESEQVIQKLLREAGRRDIPHDLVSVMGRGVEEAADWRDLRSPETYLGHARAERFVAPVPLAPSSRKDQGVLPQLGLNRWSLSGDWVVGKEAVLLNSAGGRIAVRFHARDLHMVMGTGVIGRSLRFRVLIDGSAPGSSHGTDVDEHGIGMLSDHRLYQLIRQTGTIEDHVFEIEFLDSGAEAYSFTFG
jgi:thiol-disulfide isomerase/thioredoxin